jgi:hypothetical protein
MDNRKKRKTSGMRGMLTQGNAVKEAENQAPPVSFRPSHTFDSETSVT